MNKKLFIFASLLALSAGPAWAEGINLGWNDCPSGVTYTLARTSLCTANTGNNILIGSYMPPAGVNAVSANEVVIDLQTGGATLAPWWSLRSTAPLGCRTSSMTQSGDFTSSPTTCTDYWQGGASGGVSSDAPVGNRARIKVLEALPAGSPLIGPVTEGTEYYSFKVTINNAKTTGLGACAGCSDEACIVLNMIRLNQPLPDPPVTIINPVVSQHVIWQAWTTPDPNNACPAVTPARKTTWGSIKAIYR